MSDMPAQPERATTPDGLAKQLVELLDVEELDTDLYRGRRQPGGVGRTFGGQVIAQALQAAQRSVEDKAAHSLHAYFMRPGDENFPIVFRVVRDFDGGSFATRRVIAMQRGKPILNMAASFQRAEQGLAHQAAMPRVPPPDSLKSEQQLYRENIDRIPEKLRPYFLRGRSIEVRPVDPTPFIAPAPGDPAWHCWFKVPAALPDDPALHRAVLSYASDIALLGTSVLPHGISLFDPRMQVASLDHALWLHEPFRADEWLLYSTDSPWAGHGRGFNRGQIFTLDGRLVASSAQEGLVRLKSDR